MPYHLVHVGGTWQVVKDAGGKIMGSHRSKKEAMAQLYALHMAMKKEGK